MGKYSNRCHIPQFASEQAVFVSAMFRVNKEPLVMGEFRSGDRVSKTSKVL
jgi:hypothetical protein